MSVEWKSIEEIPEHGRSVWCAYISDELKWVEYGIYDSPRFRKEEGFFIDGVIAWAYADTPEFPDEFAPNP